MIVNNLVAHKIKELCTEMGINAEYLAKELNISKTALSQMENGKVEITLKRVEAVAKVLKVPISNFIPMAGSAIQINRENSSNNLLNSTQYNHNSINIQNNYTDEKTLLLLHHSLENISKLILYYEQKKQ